MVQFTPSFFSPQKGFVVTQLSGAGCSNMGNFPVVPIAGNLEDSPFDMNSLEPFTEINSSSAGYLSVNSKKDITSRLTVTKRSAIANFDFKNSKNGTIIIGSGVNSSNEKYIKNSFIKEKIKMDANITILIEIKKKNKKEEVEEKESQKHNLLKKFKQWRV